ncbi:putative ABC transport system permease protein [Amphritea atlantica]|uniref:Putative ABC transport system permease protein n=1 Tax=Amphritea atlantica TaxID=355243 RepID=A0A1H9FZK7_9GAMM|nr:ABC transporter permease [Amphritea atlantica]SEQ43310.1 putative ABC transport system permease protein [Amphritea atlantica]
MKVVLMLALRSLYNRRVTAIMTMISIAVSVALLLGVEKIRTEAKQSFSSTISGTDLIIGARSGSVQLLLYSVFRIGNATNNISWKSYQEIASQPSVEWTIPISLGDSHRGYRVLGTTGDYFKYYRYGRKHPLVFRDGHPFVALHDVVLGAEVAQTLGYQLGQKVIISHGIGSTSFSKHKDQPFTVVGILKPTGTPLDRTLHVSLAAIEAIHIDWQSGTYIPGSGGTTPLSERKLEPKQITAMLVGLKSKLSTFQLQRSVNNYRKEALQAILPGVALQELWGMLGVVESTLLVISGFVVATGLFGMLTVLMTSLTERRREMAILRSVGVRPWQVCLLLVLETGGLTLAGIVLAMLFLYGGLAICIPLIESHLGLYLELSLPGLYELKLLLLVFVTGLLCGLIPGYTAYRYSLADGMTVRL